MPLLYPGVKVSYGTIQQMLVEAEGRAARFNAQVSLGGVEAGALDEMFISVQGEPGACRGGPRRARADHGDGLFDEGGCTPARPRTMPNWAC